MNFSLLAMEVHLCRIIAVVSLIKFINTFAVIQSMKRSLVRLATETWKLVKQEQAWASCLPSQSGCFHNNYRPPLSRFLLVSTFTPLFLCAQTIVLRVWLYLLKPLPNLAAIISLRQFEGPLFIQYDLEDEARNKYPSKEPRWLTRGWFQVNTKSSIAVATDIRNPY